MTYVSSSHIFFIGSSTFYSISYFIHVDIIQRWLSGKLVHNVITQIVVLLKYEVRFLFKLPLGNFWEITDSLGSNILDEVVIKWNLILVWFKIVVFDVIVQ